MQKLFSKTNYKIVSTSINNFKEIKNYEEIIKKEKLLKEYAKKKLINNEYFPGFFIVCAKKIST